VYRGINSWNAIEKKRTPPKQKQERSSFKRAFDGARPFHFNEQLERRRSPRREDESTRRDLFTLSYYDVSCVSVFICVVFFLMVCGFFAEEEETKEKKKTLASLFFFNQKFCFILRSIKI
tara:strand:+ start:75 stop:434 length:360 start_codon:yes stop_codon:yes gene_type:complete